MSRFNFLPQIVMDEGQSQITRKSAEIESTEGASAPLLISPISKRGGSDRYDVFLSFRGLDTRKGFTDHLYHSLVNAGIVRICMFRDENSIPIGVEFGSQILNAITRSKISILVISENYASSKWCLRELIHIMDCKKSTSHIVLPIFYKVTPSDVRHLKGNFGKAFDMLQECFDKKNIEEGRQALREVSNLNGWESEKILNGHEGELIKLVVETVLRELRKDFQLHVPTELVGFVSPVKKITNWIRCSPINARMIGIYGMGGIGKTTLAKYIFNQLLNEFSHVSFLQDIRETTQHHGGTQDLQSQLIFDILQCRLDVSKVDDGINIIKSRFQGKKVLIVLDDIDHNDQLTALVGERNWFTSGSIIIVTTRNQTVLDQSKFKVDYKYELNELDKEHSLILFNRHAFRMDHSLWGFEDLSHHIVSTMGGLPLALKVVGSYLYGKTNRNVWQDVLKKLRKEPDRDVQKILKISYDALDDGHKEIFLDIACFFIGKEIKFAIYMWNDCGFYASQGIEELKLRCLIKIGHDGKIKMHDQLRDLGRSIICQGQPPEKHSRLWVPEEASKVLMDKKGTKRIQVICLNNYYDRTYTNEQFKSLQSLRFLQLGGATLSGDFDNLFSELRWLQWSLIKPELSFLATNLRPPKLVVLDLSFNNIKEDWRGWSLIMAAKHVQVLNLGSCIYLRCTPNFSTLTKLEILILKCCLRLKRVHPSIGKVKSLVSLNLSKCGNLKKLPEEVGKLEALKELVLDETGITKIPTSVGSLSKLEKLSAFHCRSLREIPNSIGNLSSLQHLNLRECESLREIPSSIGNLSSLQYLNLQECESLREIPCSIGDLQNLQHLDMSDTAIEKIPNAIGRLKKLRWLSFARCSSLTGVIPNECSDLSSLEIIKINEKPTTDLPVSINNLPSLQLSNLMHLEELILYQCNLLECFLDLPSRLLKLRVGPCRKLMLPELGGFKYLEELSIRDCSCFKRLDLSPLNRLKRLHAWDCDNLVEIQAHHKLQFLEGIVICDCRSLERLILPELQCLKQLEATHCYNLVDIQGLDWAEFLEALDISDCRSIERLPDLACFTTLKELNINGCHNLRGVESLERFLSCRSIYITGCQSLERLPNLSKFENLETFTLIDSFGVTKIHGIEESRSLKHINITGCKSIETLPDLSGCEKLQSLVVEDCKKLTQLQGLEKLDSISLVISGCDLLESVSRIYVAWPSGLVGHKIMLR